MITGDKVYNMTKVEDIIREEFGNINGLTVTDVDKNADHVFIFISGNWENGRLSEYLSVLSDMARVYKNLHLVQYSEPEGEQPFSVIFSISFEDLAPYMVKAVEVDLSSINQRMSDGDYIVRLTDGYIVHRIKNHVGETKIYISKHILGKGNKISNLAVGEVMEVPPMIE